MRRPAAPSPQRPHPCRPLRPSARPADSRSASRRATGRTARQRPPAGLRHGPSGAAAGPRASAPPNSQGPGPATAPAPSGDPCQPKCQPGQGAACQDRDRTKAEAEHRDYRRDDQHQGGGVQCSPDRQVQVQAPGGERAKLAEQHMQPEPGVVYGRGRNLTLRLWPTIFSGEIDVLPS